MLVTFEDYRKSAQRKLPRLMFDYVDGGSYAEETLRRNTSDFANVELRQRVMRDVSKLSTGIELFGQKLAMPLVLAPVGMAGLLAKRGEVQAAKAAKAAGLPFTLSTMSICGLEEVSKVTPPWFQLYVLKDRGYMHELLAQAKGLGSPVLVFTVDLPVPGSRYRDMRSGMFGGGLGLKRAMDVASHPGWLWDVWLNGRPHTFANAVSKVGKGAGFAEFWVWVRENFDPTMTWDDLGWIRKAWGGPIVVKGVLDAEDARRAADLGVDGVIVSNHGGRQLDGAPSAIRALPPVVDAVGGRTAVLMDGGVRTGLDVLKALSLGAQACLIGRPWAMSLAARGERGVASMLATMKAELHTAMALTGCTDIKKAGPDLLFKG